MSNEVLTEMEGESASELAVESAIESVDESMSDVPYDLPSELGSELLSDLAVELPNAGASFPWCSVQASFGRRDRHCFRRGLDDSDTRKDVLGLGSSDAKSDGRSLDLSFQVSL